MKNTLFNKAFGGIDSMKSKKEYYDFYISRMRILTKKELKKLYPPKRTMFQGVVIFIKKLFKK